MSPTLICPCDAEDPAAITNPPGRDTIAYRAGDYTTFRRALLRARDGEAALAGWHPAEGSDLALQLLEWWAYLADILTFYNERALGEALLRTAALPEDVRRIVRLIGYRPRPGIGATGVLAAIVADGPQPYTLTLPRGFPIQSVPPPGSRPQIFELDADTDIGVPGSAGAPSSGASAQGSGGSSPGYTISAVAGRIALRAIPPDTGDATDAPAPDDSVPKVVFRGVLTNLSRDDRVLFLSQDWATSGDYVLGVVDDVVPSWDSRGRATTTVTWRPGFSPPADTGSYRVLKASKFAHLWLYHERFPLQTAAPDPLHDAGQVLLDFLDPLHLGPGHDAPRAPASEPPSVLDKGWAHLEAITRGIRAGDPVLFEQTADTSTFALVRVAGYTEDIWYANPPEAGNPGGPPVGPPSSPPAPNLIESAVQNVLGGSQPPAAVPIPIPHTKITFTDNATVEAMAADKKTVVAHYGWQDVGEIVPPSDTSTTTGAADGGPSPVVLMDADGNHVPALLGSGGVTIPGGPPPVAPLRALFNLLPVSRGQTVSGETLGSGDPTVEGQEFVLRRSPLTYLADTGPGSMDGYRSTLAIRVDGIAWHEVRSFYGQGPDARVFVTKEDDDQKTHVRFGDGTNGARLPAGRGNVVADYRVGSGADSPPAGSLTTVLSPRPRLLGVANPVAVGGGSDPDPPAQIRAYAPRSVLTFGRAVSGDDYETIAAQTPGVARAKVYWAWDADHQRTVVKVYVGDDDAAVSAARATLRAFADPNRPVVVARAGQVVIDLTFTLVVDPSHDREAVVDAVRAALLDPQQAPFGAGVVRIGQPIYDSHIYDACLRVPGAVAVHGLRFALVKTIFTVLDEAPTSTVMTTADTPSGSGSPTSGSDPSTGAPLLSTEDFANASNTISNAAGVLSSPIGQDLVQQANDLLALQSEINTLAGMEPAPAGSGDPGSTGSPTGMLDLGSLLGTNLFTQPSTPTAAPQAPPGPRWTVTTILTQDLGSRHAPGEGSFYVLRGENLHISPEVARNGR